MTIYAILKDGIDTGQRVTAGRINRLTYEGAEGVEQEQQFPRTHPWAGGLQCARLEALGYSRGDEIIPDPIIPSHESVVSDAGNALLSAHLNEGQQLSIVVRLLELVGTSAVTGTSLTNGQKTLAQKAVAATKWAADVKKEMARAIADEDDPIWPAWDAAWEVLYDHI